LPADTNEDFESVKSTLLSLASLQVATDNFHESNKIGEGGFGAVYKGILHGQEVAVKRMAKGSNQGLEELKNELVLVAKLHHRNLVRLVGFCLDEGERLLIYEYMSNKSLDTFLFGTISITLFNLHILSFHSINNNFFLLVIRCRAKEKTRLGGKI
jgi:serine/threonine protein kinase